jgi:hypothetical protein
MIIWNMMESLELVICEVGVLILRNLLYVLSFCIFFLNGGFSLQGGEFIEDN